MALTGRKIIAGKKSGSLSPHSLPFPSLLLSSSVSSATPAGHRTRNPWLKESGRATATAAAAHTTTTTKNNNNKENPTRHPRKRFYRARAHSNPLSDSHFPVPVTPSHFDYSLHFTLPTPPPSDDDHHLVRFADVGCGFGGLLVQLSTLFPDTLMLGMELRDKVSEYVKERISALRSSNPGQYGNISVIRTNSMKYIPNYFIKGQLTKMFFLFPDPHFKEKNHRRRVISPFLPDEYAYVMQVGGILYTITDVEELGVWMRKCLEEHPLFEQVPEGEIQSDPVVGLLGDATEEGKKVARNGGKTFRSVFRRVAAPRDDDE